MSCGNENPEMYRGQFERGSSYCTPNGVFLFKKMDLADGSGRQARRVSVRLAISRGGGVFSREGMAVMASRTAYSNAYRLLG